MKKSIIANCSLLVVFLVLAVVQQNYEFLFYAATLIIALAILYLADKKYDFSSFALWGFFVWLLLHLLGGMASISGTRLYDTILISLVGEPYDILKYDQLVHVTCYFVIAILIYEALAQLIAKDHGIALVVFTVLAATGIGGMNEMIEFAAVVFLGSTGVGGYYNTALDIVANFLGACLAMATVYFGSSWRVRDERD